MDKSAVLKTPRCWLGGRVQHLRSSSPALSPNLFDRVAVEAKHLQYRKPTEGLEAFVHRGARAGALAGHASNAKLFAMRLAVVLDMVKAQRVDVVAVAAQRAFARAIRVVVNGLKLQLESVLGLGLVVSRAVLGYPLTVPLRSLGKSRLFVWHDAS